MVFGACIRVLRGGTIQDPTDSCNHISISHDELLWTADWQVLGTPMSETCDELSTSNLPKLQICAVATCAVEEHLEDE